MHPTIARLSTRALRALFIPTVISAAAVQLSAAVLYWNDNSPGGGNWIGQNWSDSEFGSTGLNFTSGEDSVIISRTGATLNLAGYSSAITVLGLGIQNGATITSATTGNNELILTGAGSGDLEWRGVTAGNFRLTLNTAVAWSGKITDTSTTAVAANGNAAARILIQNAGAVGAATRIALDGNGALVLHNSTGNQTVTLGELSGSSANALITSINTNGGRHLRVAQSAANTTYAGRITPDTREFAFEKSGEGRLRLTGVLGDANHTGTLSLAASEGALYLNGTGNALGTVTVASGATLGGIGDIQFKGTNTLTIKDGGILDPGDVTDAGIATTGTLTLKAASGATGAGLVFEGAATIRFNLDGDKIVLEGASMTGSASGGGLITFDFTGSSPSIVGSTIDLIDFGGTTQGIALGKFAASDGWTGSFLYGGDGNLLQFHVTGAPIPEPSSAALILGLAAGSCLAWRRR